MNCGRAPGGDLAEGLGLCPAATADAADGFCGGDNGGRACSFIHGTFCVEAHPEDEFGKLCTSCSFYHHLVQCEGELFSRKIFEIYTQAATTD